MRNTKEGRKKRARERERVRERERDKERESEKGGGPKRLKRNKGKHRRINNKNALFRGKNSFFDLEKAKSTNNKKTKTKKNNKIRRV